MPGKVSTTRRRQKLFDRVGSRMNARSRGCARAIERIVAVVITMTGGAVLSRPAAGAAAVVTIQAVVDSGQKRSGASIRIRAARQFGASVGAFVAGQALELAMRRVCEVSLLVPDFRYVGRLDSQFE